MVSACVRQAGVPLVFIFMIRTPRLEGPIRGRFVADREWSLHLVRQSVPVASANITQQACLTARQHSASLNSSHK